MAHGDPLRHKDMDPILRELRDDFVDWLGESKYMHGLTGIPPSRFSHVNSNGLWEYSPFLCGAGLEEALELAFGMGLFLWDRVPEPFCVIHLHNMLVQKGYISQPVGLHGTLQELFTNSFFKDGKVPTSNFQQAFQARVGSPASRRDTVQKQALRRHVAKSATDLHGLLDSNTNTFFQDKSLLRLYRAANWLPDRIREEDLPVSSSLAIFRLAETKQSTDPATGKTTLEDTDLVKRARSFGMDDTVIMDLTSKLASVGAKTTIDPEVLERVKAQTSNTYTVQEPSKAPLRPNPRKCDIATDEYLNTLKVDLIGEINGLHRPLASLNYVVCLTIFMMLFLQIEDELKRRRNPLWVQAYEVNSTMMREKRLSLTAMVLKGDDEECLQVMTDKFQGLRTGFQRHIYWKELVPLESFTSGDGNALGPDACTVM